METEAPRNKVEAIYQLREAVEAKAEAEHQLEADASAVARDVLLAAQIDVEAKTQDAIDVCHECGESHVGEEAHSVRARINGYEDNVVHVNFRPDTRSA